MSLWISQRENSGFYRGFRLREIQHCILHHRCREPAADERNLHRLYAGTAAQIRKAQGGTDRHHYGGLFKKLPVTNGTATPRGMDDVRPGVFFIKKINLLHPRSKLYIKRILSAPSVVEISGIEPLTS